jgi:hypothetical protein
VTDKQTQQGEALTTEQQFYRVEESVNGRMACDCEQCTVWTITYDDSEPTEIGTSWQGPDGKETAEDICDLLNMAYAAGQESKVDNKEEAKLVTFFRSPEGDAIGRDGDADCLSPAETAIRWIRRAIAAGVRP